MRRPSLHERRWGAEEHDFAAAWRSQPKWVVSRTLKSVGPNATLVEDDIEAVIRGLKAQPVGEIEVAGPDLSGPAGGPSETAGPETPPDGSGNGQRTGS